MPDVPPDRMTDGELIARVGEGDRGAFELLYRRYARPVFALALRRLGDRGRAEDAVQETFASVWRSARSYRLERGPGAPWLYAVARNAIIDRRRARVESPSEIPRDTVCRRRAGRARRGELDRLAHPQRARASSPSNERAVLELAYWGGLSQSEIAEYLADPPRHGEDTNPDRAVAAGRPPGGGAHVSGA